uniref:Uncharacterized protein n=1 Tax=Knipowitschia caucasica TaxID=637954 RepID=A0AAV2L0D5_KNICA
MSCILDSMCDDGSIRTDDGTFSTPSGLRSSQSLIRPSIHPSLSSLPRSHATWSQRAVAPEEGSQRGVGGGCVEGHVEGPRRGNTTEAEMKEMGKKGRIKGKG